MLVDLNSGHIDNKRHLSGLSIDHCLINCFSSFLSVARFMATRKRKQTKPGRRKVCTSAMFDHLFSRELSALKTSYSVRRLASSSTGT